MLYQSTNLFYFSFTFSSFPLYSLFGFIKCCKSMFSFQNFYGCRFVVMYISFSRYFSFQLLHIYIHTYILSIYYILFYSVAITTQKLNQNCHKMCIYELILKLYFSTRDF